MENSCRQHLWWQSGKVVPHCCGIVRRARNAVSERAPHTFLSQRASKQASLFILSGVKGRRVCALNKPVLINHRRPPRTSPLRNACGAGRRRLKSGSGACTISLPRARRPIPCTASDTELILHLFVEAIFISLSHGGRCSSPRAHTH